jgi:hypothetical protein
LDVQKSSACNVTTATSIQRRRTSLLKRIQNYISTRPRYMPGLELFLCNTPTHTEDLSTATPDLTPLHLPSSVPSEKRPSICIPGLAEIEDRLRFAQACEALTELHCQLTKRTYASRYRTANISSQSHFTCFRSCKNRQNQRLRQLACVIMEHDRGLSICGERENGSKSCRNSNLETSVG